VRRAAAPGEPPFVKEGDRVKKGQTVCIIEAMKLMNEIEVGSGLIVQLKMPGLRVWGFGAAAGIAARALAGTDSSLLRLSLLAAGSVVTVYGFSCAVDVIVSGAC
jgi:hypothetical protein